MLECADLSMTYGGNGGVRRLSWSFAPGVTGLLGHNGSGKTTLLKLLATVFDRYDGAIRWQGVDVRGDRNAYRAVMSYVPQQFGVYPHLSAMEFLRYLGGLRGMNGRACATRAAALLERMALGAHAHRQLRTYSGGMLKRLGLCAALIGDPRVLLLDEPTAGVDERERKNMIDAARENSERVVILATHIYSDLAVPNAKFLVLDAGTVSRSGNATELSTAIRESTSTPVLWER